MNRTASWIRLGVRLAAALVAALCSTAATAATFTVNRTADTLDAVPGDGLCADAVDGGCSLRAAVVETNALTGADTIVLPAGIFMFTRTGIDEDASLDGDLDVTDAVTIAGAGVDASVVDGAALDRVLDLRAGATDVALRDLTVRNGALAPTARDAGGAGLRVAAGVQLDLARVTVRDNRADSFVDAVGISNLGCIVGERVRVIGNRDADAISASAAAGGIYTNGATSCLTLTDSELRGNWADHAGALYVERDVPVTLRRTLITDNEARFSGAMLVNMRNRVLLENVTISGNRGNGAILNDGGSTLTLVNCTVTRNTGRNGFTPVVGGIYDVHGGFGLTYLSNTILSGNGPGSLANDCQSVTSQGGGNLIGDSARCRHSARPDDRLDVDPGLLPLADNGGYTLTHLPGPGAIDAGVDAACLAVDQRGVARPVDGDGDGVARCDSGAVEWADGIFSSGFE